MRVRGVIRSSLVLLVAAILAAPLALQQGYSDATCPAGTYPVVNTDQCVSGPGGSIIVNKVGKLMDIGKCATYRGREYDEMSFHRVVHPASTAQAAFVTTNDFDANNIAVIVDDGSIIFTDSLGTRIDTVDAVKKFMATHQDVYDYVAFFPNFNHAEGSFHNHIKNDVLGINVPIQDNSATYGTHNLKSLLLYRNFTVFPADPYARIPTNNDSTMSLIAQETGHRWAAWVRRDKDPGPRVRATTDLLGRNLAHWCFYLNTPSVTTSSDPTRPGFSSMEGNFWKDNLNGTFTTDKKSDGYSQVDQYLMGFRTVDQVDPFFLLNTGNGKVTPDCSHTPYTPGVDTPWTVSYPKINVSISDIISVEGYRNPDSGASQKNWRMAFVLLVPQGQTATAAQISQLDTYRRTWETYFRDESLQGRMYTTLGPVDMDGDGFASNVDCDEENPAINPGATEVCNGYDDDCDGIIDEGFDLDQDLYTSCSGDCDDNDRYRNPGLTEWWDGKDNNCDGIIDNVSLVDADGDGYYANPDPNSALLPDCNDSNAAVNPGAVEIVNGIDDNCNNAVDCADPTVFRQSESGSRAHDGFDNDCNGVIDG